MFGLTGITLPTGLVAEELVRVMMEVQGGVISLLAILLAFGVVVFCRNSIELKNTFQPKLSYSLNVILLFIFSFFSLGKYSEFLYFQF